MLIKRLSEALVIQQCSNKVLYTPYINLPKMSQYYNKNQYENSFYIFYSKHHSFLGLCIKILKTTVLEHIDYTYIDR